MSIESQQGAINRADINDEAEAAKAETLGGNSRVPPAKPPTKMLSTVREFHRHTIRTSSLAIVDLRRARDIQFRELDDQIYEAERAFIETRSNILARKAELAEETAADISAHQGMIDISESALATAGARTA